MPLTGDQEAVGALGTDCAYPSFGERVGPGTLRRSRDNGCAVAGEEGVEGGGELAVGDWAEANNVEFALKGVFIALRWLTWGFTIVRVWA
ncbi:hypothetical protein [Streptomyces asiaticus]|uniref:hypothetical protein n=1 Tax=Streptomyces asiaticus TaxID=114695 RepID=UPI003805BE22